VRLAGPALALLVFASAAAAEEKKDDAPRITAISPLHLILGETQAVRLRGLKLKEVTEVRCTPAMPATIKEKKDATPPNGLEAKDVGDQELVAELKVPADCKSSSVEVQVVAPGGSAQRAFLATAKDALAAEKEPNNGFAEAQPVDCSKPIAGRIDPDKDVDVYRIDGRSGATVNVRIAATEAGSLLDPILTIFDAAGHLLAAADDSDGSRDTRLTVTPKDDGPLSLVVSDAHDRGGPWHEYRLQFEPQR
jgi:hypothetical protein